MITFKLKLGLGVRHDPAVTTWFARGVAVDLQDRLHLEFRRRESWDPRVLGRSDDRGGMVTGTTVAVGPLAVRVARRRMTCKEAVGAPPYLRDPACDWLVDELDGSFNALAIASLKYHCAWAITDIGDELRTEFGALIVRLSEPAPTYTDAEMKVLDAAGDQFPPAAVGEAVEMRPMTPEERVVHDAWREREASWEKRLLEARHDFIEVLPHLWS